MKKGVTAFILAVTLIISIAGCNGDKSGSSSVSTPIAPSSSAPASTAPSSSAPASTGSAASPVSGNTAIDKTGIQIFLQEFFEIPLEGKDLNNLSDSDAFIKCISIMVKNKEYSKEGDEFFFASDKINEYARMYCQKKNFNYTESHDLFRYDADKKGFLSTLEFGMLDDEGPKRSRAIEVTDTKIVGGTIEVFCVFQLVYEEEEAVQYNKTIDYKIILEEDNSTYSIVSVNKIFDPAICGIEFGLSPEQLLQSLKQRNIAIIKPKEGESYNQIENPVNDGRRYNYDGSFTFKTNSINFFYNDKGEEINIFVNNAHISTNEGLKAGDPANKMKDIYGNNYDYDQDYDCYRYYNGSQYLFIYFTDNKVAHWNISIYPEYDND